MDGRRFDGLAKGVAADDRRSVLRGIGVLALGALGLVAARGAEAADVSAEDTRRKCFWKCENRFCDGFDGVKQQRCERRCKRECRRHHRRR